MFASDLWMFLNESTKQDETKLENSPSKVSFILLGPWQSTQPVCLSNCELPSTRSTRGECPWLCQGVFERRPWVFGLPKWTVCSSKEKYPPIHMKDYNWQKIWTTRNEPRDVPIPMFPFSSVFPSPFLVSAHFLSRRICGASCRSRRCSSSSLQEMLKPWVDSRSWACFRPNSSNKSSPQNYKQNCKCQTQSKTKKKKKKNTFFFRFDLDRVGRCRRFHFEGPGTWPGSVQMALWSTAAGPMVLPRREKTWQLNGKETWKQKKSIDTFGYFVECYCSLCVNEKTHCFEKKKENERIENQQVGGKWLDLAAVVCTSASFSQEALYNGTT